jgi:diguanylate cyclase (GGDEF)-like protein
MDCFASRFRACRIGLESLEAALCRRPRSFIERTSVAVCLLLAVGDWLTGAEVAFGFFYLLPMAFCSWFGGLKTGIKIAGLSSILWLGVELNTQVSTVSPAVLTWNTCSQLLACLSTAWLVAGLRKALHREMDRSRTDALTGLLNRLGFLELAQLEFDRARRARQPLSAVYLDVDGFKSVNDTLGHTAGDALLRLVGQALGTTLRTIDLAGRVGGDEFILLLPGADEVKALAVGARIEALLEREARAHGYQVRFSHGTVSGTGHSSSLHELIAEADRRMYRAKRVRLEPRPGLEAGEARHR